jgi:hypothetical protein
MNFVLMRMELIRGVRLSSFDWPLQYLLSRARAISLCGCRTVTFVADCALSVENIEDCNCLVRCYWASFVLM